MNLELEIQRMPELPKEPGVYVVWLLGARFPVTLGWSRLSTRWLRGCVAVQVEAWAGPLPDRGIA